MTIFSCPPVVLTENRCEFSLVGSASAAGSATGSGSASATGSITGFGSGSDNFIYQMSELKIRIEFRSLLHQLLLCQIIRALDAENRYPYQIFW